MLSSTTAVEFMVGRKQSDVMLKDKLLDGPNVMGPHSFDGSQGDGLQPKLTVSIRCSNVNVRGFDSLVGVKMKSKGANAQHRRHGKQNWDAT